MKTTKFTHALLLGIGSIFSIFHPAKPFPAVGKSVRADYENLQKDMTRLTQDRIKRISGHG